MDWVTTFGCSPDVHTIYVDTSGAILGLLHALEQVDEHWDTPSFVLFPNLHRLFLSEVDFNSWSTDGNDLDQALKRMLIRRHKYKRPLAELHVELCCGVKGVVAEGEKYVERVVWDRHDPNEEHDTDPEDEDNEDEGGEAEEGQDEEEEEEEEEDDDTDDDDSDDDDSDDDDDDDDEA